MRLLPHPATEDIELTEVLRALSDPVRLEIVVRLALSGVMNCGEAGDALGVHKSTASHHYRTLRAAGVVMTRQEGRVKYMSLRRDDLESRFPGLLDSVLSAAGIPNTVLSPTAALSPSAAASAGVPAQR
ncbi:ArsR/SmtB family transcription factor [Nonomuraea sp. NPDC050153]|uniref:ArsR/SmtB family transcription factor n=1 Tax=Nonomuraea sp. NPDC050153 TaxID=3364359 RepID=UPI0037BC8A13